MKTALNTVGYTILEVLIVFAITGGILVTAMNYTAGQQNKNEFTQAINDIQAQINDVINNVQVGYYANANGFNCNATSTGPSIASGSATLGTHEECSFVGRAMQFMVGGDQKAFNTYNIAGLRLKFGSTQAARTYGESFPTAIYPGTSSHTTVPDTAQKNTLLYGMKAVSIKYNSTQTANAVAFVTDLGANNTQTLNLIPVVSGDQSAGSVADAIDGINDSTLKNPSGGVAICFQSGGTNRYGVVTINSNQRKLSTSLDIGSGVCP